MNSTNRAANRIFLFLIGALLLTAGGAGASAALSPGAARRWRAYAADGRSAMEHAQRFDLDPVGIGRSVPWFLLAITGAAAVVIAALLLFVFAQGRGRIGRIADGWHVADSPADGFLSVDVRVARDTIRRAARDIRGISAPAVDSYRVAGEPALKVSVNIADGIDPASVVPALEAAIAEWDALLGERCPAYLQLSAGAGLSASGLLRIVGGQRREPSFVD
jgi:hypothetical protein